MDKKNLIIKLFKSLRGEKESSLIFLWGEKMILAYFLLPLIQFIFIHKLIIHFYVFYEIEGNVNFILFNKSFIFSFFKFLKSLCAFSSITVIFFWELTKIYQFNITLFYFILFKHEFLFFQFNFYFCTLLIDDKIHH